MKQLKPIFIIPTINIECTLELIRRFIVEAKATIFEEKSQKLVNPARVLVTLHGNRKSEKGRMFLRV